MKPWPKATEWFCRYCRHTFWWHPGNSGCTMPSECGCGHHNDTELLFKFETVNVKVTKDEK